MGSIYAQNVTAGWRAAEAARHAEGATLASALNDARDRTLGLFAAYEAALGPDLRCQRSHEVNLPLWELGHIGWFTDWWITRNPERALGIQANPFVTRLPARRANADALYDSSNVAHATRWTLDLPDASAVRAELQTSLEETLAWLSDTRQDDTALYLFRLALFHEDMHTEAATYMAQTLGFDPFSHGARPHLVPPMGQSQELQLPATDWHLGRRDGGFSFDNELVGETVALAATGIDSAPVTWARYLPFVESGAADQRAFWSNVGWSWREAHANGSPRYLRHSAVGWEAQRFGVWHALDLEESAVHLTCHEAEAWCRWAGRRLPSEAEWEAAAHLLPGFQWGSAWEWTASEFRPLPGFEPHPYRDYSAPWFDGRPVLKGASPATAPRMRHPRYRNFFTADRNDIMAGFRSAALSDHR